MPLETDGDRLKFLPSIDGRLSLPSRAYQLDYGRGIIGKGCKGSPKSVSVAENIVCRSSNRVFVGLPPRRDQDWIDLSSRFAVDAPTCEYLELYKFLLLRETGVYGQAIDLALPCKRHTTWQPNRNMYGPFVRKRMLTVTIKPIKIKDLTLSDGAFIPEEAQLSVPTYAIHRDMSGIYENPSIYDRFWFSSHRDDANESVMTSDGGSQLAYIGTWRSHCQGYVPEESTTDGTRFVFHLNGPHDVVLNPNPLDGRGPTPALLDPTVPTVLLALHKVLGDT
ncbi:hypothetical protein EDC04DRAFT_2612585 [Pisolithus marmoratus]|nr:hypothetical protein EDC04DRAFT_2612585 [Pisolithus marmoratus]